MKKREVAGVLTAFRRNRNQKEMKPVGKDNNDKKFILIGALLGLIFTVILYFTQDIEAMFYFSAAPIYIHSLLGRTEGFISIITFIYFIGIFSLLGYIFSSRLAKKFKFFALIIIVILHCVLLRLQGEAIFDGLPKAISNAFPSDLK